MNFDTNTCAGFCPNLTNIFASTQHQHIIQFQSYYGGNLTPVPASVQIWPMPSLLQFCIIMQNHKHLKSNEVQIQSGISREGIMTSLAAVSYTFADI